MSRDKQIEEMARAIYNGGSYDTHYTDDSVWLAEELYNAGYRKAEDVAREIFEEIDTLIVRRMIPEIAWIDDRFITDITELRKKYESEGEG